MRFIWAAVLSSAGLFAGAASAQEISTGTLHWGGHLIVRYTADTSTGAVDAFTVGETLLHALYKPHPKVAMRARLVLNKLHSRQEGLRHAYLEYEVFPRWDIEAGQISIPVSREITAALPDLDFSEPALFARRLFNREPEGTDIGAKIKGRWKMFHLGAAAVNGAGPNAADDTGKKSFAGRLGGEWREFALGGYAYLGDQADSAGPVLRNRFGGELRLGPPGQNLRAEYHRGQDGTLVSDGWFIQMDAALGIFSPEAYRKLEWLQRLRPVVRFESYDPDRQTRNDRQMTTRATIHYYFSNDFRLSVQYDAGREEDPKKQIDNDAFTAQCLLRF
ncbi:MAG: hypothetical protein HYT79_01210 [Elusimicrobia bacterium]|nr:hypothetical protein [Elusimicrobiota bacterium]